MSLPLTTFCCRECFTVRAELTFHVKAGGKLIGTFNVTNPRLLAN